MVGFKASVQRTGARWRAQLRKQEASSGAQERVSREVQESELHTGALFLTVRFGHRPQAAGPISVRMGRSPAHVQAFYLLTLCDEKYTFTHVLKLLPGLHIYNSTTFVILLIHTFLQLFIQV